MPRCWAHSPTAMTPARLVRIESSTMIPRSQTIPIERASSVSGRIPIDTTTRSASSSEPSVKRRPWARSGPMICCVLRSNSTSMSRPLQRRGEQRAGAGVELALHEAVEQVHDGDGAALGGDAARGLEAEQAAADDGGALDPALGGGEADRVAVGGVAEGVHAGEVDARDRRHERLRAGGEDELVVAQLVDVVEAEHAALGVDPRDHPADDELDVVVLVPLRRAQLQRLRILAADEDLRQPDAVVGRRALAADQRDRDVGVALAQRFAYGLAGDSSADDHDPTAHASIVREAGFLTVP